MNMLLDAVKVGTEAATVLCLLLVTAECII